MNIDNLYRQVIMDHYQHPRNQAGPAHGSITIETNNPNCGDRIFIHLLIKNDQIVDATFTGEGCSISLASASMMTEAVKGLALKTALELVYLFSEMMQGEEVDTNKFNMDCIESLKGVTKFPARIRCATLAWEGLKKGLIPPS
ncbi:MAG: hypothetical protein RLZ12_955 [Bacillota bacterium]|jgi:nitrogen fixation NifU-like protein